MGPVRPEGQWWAEWQRVGDDQRAQLLSDIESQVRGELPATTEVFRRFLSCYPRHALLRLVLPGEYGPRESYAFYAPGQVYPLTWSQSDIRAFDEVGLEIQGVEQAEEYLRFSTWAQITPFGRGLIVEDRGQLVFREGESLSEDEERRLDEILTPLTQVASHPDDLDGSYRFEGALLWDGVLIRAEFLVGWLQFGRSESGIQAPGWRHFEPEPPTQIHLPVVEDLVGESDRCFVLVKEASLSAERFIRRLRRGPVNQLRVTEPVRLRNEVFADAVVLSQVTFDHGIDLEGARFEKGLTLEQCVFEGQLNLRQAHVEGALNAPGLWFHREGKHRALGSLKKLSRWGSFAVDLEASGLRVAGSVYLEGLRADNLVDLSRAKVDGDLRLGGTQIGRRRERPSEDPVTHFALRLDGAEIGGDLDFAYVRDNKYLLASLPEDEALDESIPGYSTPQTVVRGTIWANRLHVHGEATLTGMRCEGNLVLTSGTFGADLNLGAHVPKRRLIVLGSCWLQTATIGGDVLLQGMHGGGDVLFGSSEIGGSLYGQTTAGPLGRIAPLRVKGQLNFSGVRTNDIDLQGADLGWLQIVTGEIGRFRLQPGIAEVTGESGSDDVDRRVRQLMGSVGRLELWDLTVRKRITILTGIHKEARLGNLDCGGDLEFWSDRLTRGALDEELVEGEAWAEGMPRERFELRTTVAEELKCTGLRIAGRLMLTNVRCGGRILFKNCEIEQDLSCGSDGPDRTSRQDRTTTECSHLDLELTRCGGDVDLSGLRVTQEGSVHARQLQVTGRILCARPLGGHEEVGDLIPSSTEERVSAEIGGDLDLSVAEAAQLVLVGSSLGGKVNLERGRFRRLDIVEPWKFTQHNLTDIRVDRWQIADEHLRTFLAASKPFARATYVEIEKVLRNKAQDAEADRVYRAMRARAIDEAKKAWDLRRDGGAKPASAEPAKMDGRKPDRSTGADDPHGLRHTEAGGAPEKEPKREKWWTRAAGPVSYFLRTTGSRMQGMLYGWGTLYWAPLLVFSLLSVPLSWALLSNPQNVAPAPELIAASGLSMDAADPSDLGVDWGPSDGLWLTIRYHVPVVPLSAREDYRPAQRFAELAISRARTVRFVFSTESYAFLVYLLNWILWPLFLVGLARRIVRETT